MPREVTTALLDAIQDGFNRHDVDAILSHFVEDCEWLMARGPDSIGRVIALSFRKARRKRRNCARVILRTMFQKGARKLMQSLETAGAPLSL